MEIKIVHLGENDPDPAEGENWILIEELDSGSWYGTGFGVTADGKDVVYISESSADAEYLKSLEAAQSWAEAHGVRAIYVRKL